MKHRLRLRRLTALVIAAVLATMSLVLVGPASASGATTPVSSASPSAASQPVASPPAASQHAGGGSHTDAGSSHQYKPAGCNSPSEARTEDGVAYVRCFAMGLADDNGKLLRFVDGPPSSALTPEDLQRAYNLPDAGSGMTVAIVDPFGYNAAESDLAVYRSEYGLPPCTTDNGCFTKIDQYGGTSYPPQNAKWSVEAALDLDAVSAACPKCHILLVQADDNSTLNLGKAVDTAVAMGADVVSNSYGNYDGFPSEQQFDHFYDHPGVAITVSTGDIGNVVSWPSTAGTVTAVGGTSLHADDSERGWSESAWDEGGSGCSHYEPRPSYQEGVETTCGDFGATADISVVGDPATGLAVYNTLGHSGWSQTGGTSLSSPLAAGMYALAGEATPGTYPVTYPYLAAPEHLNDITAGANNSCGTKLCEAGPGWDGPTGLGTPDGVQALTQGETGEVVGTVTSGGEPLPGVTITATDPDGNEFTATSGDDGGYDLYAPVGTYDVTATKYAYEEGTVTDVVVAVDDEVTTDFTLTALPSETVSGRVTDGSGHGWPMRAKITIDGYPYGAIYSDPYTGHYSVDLPVGSTYQMHAEPVDMAGYQPTDVSVDLTGDGAGAERDVEIALKVDTSACVAPGYAFNDVGTTETFTGWDGTTAEDGWTVTDNIGNGQTWQFDNPGGWDGPPGGDGDFA
ncbi:MAG: carboxypeptidase regulatory-like domain-containing protein, partial [Nocardioidaceae bacterium]